MERSPDDVAMPLRFELEQVAVFNVLYIWALPWAGLSRWLHPFATLVHSVHRQPLRSKTQM